VARGESAEGKRKKDKKKKKKKTRKKLGGNVDSRE
jgi:hypothetical protein